VPVLFPRPTANLDGRKTVDASTYRPALHNLLKLCDTRDERGRAIRLVPHQGRHTLGARLINKLVAQEVVRRILDHDSHTMTAALCPAVRHHHPLALGERPEGQRQGRRCHL
jgi:integrase